MRDKNCVERLVCDRLEVWECIIALIFRMHSAIEHETLIADLQVIRVRTDLGTAGQVSELQGAFLLLLLLSQFSE